MLGKSNILRDKWLRKETGAKEEVTEVGGDPAGRFILRGQVQKCFEKGKVIGLQGSPGMSWVQGMRSIGSLGGLAGGGRGGL